MRLELTIYKDETLTEIREKVEADGVKIPYRVAMQIISSLDGMNIENDNDILKFVTGSTGNLDKIIKATFGLKESDLDCIDSLELIGVATELYKWAVGKFATLRGKEQKNALTEG